MKEMLLGLILVSTTGFADVTINEGESFLKSLSSIQSLRGTEGCENIKIIKSDNEETNYYILVGKNQTIPALNPYTLSSTRIANDELHLKYTVRGGSITLPYPSTTKELTLVKGAKGVLKSLNYSYIVKENPFQISEKIEINCM